MRVSLAPFTLRDYRGDPAAPSFKDGIRSLLRRVKKIGYEGIEMGTPPGFTHQEYRDFMDETGLAVATVGIRPMVLEGEEYAAVMEECVTLGAKNVMVSSMPNIALGNPYELDRFIASLNRAGKALRGAGIHLSYHNHAVDFSRVNGKTIIETILDGTDPAWVSMEPDTHWIQAGGGHVIT